MQSFSQTKTDIRANEIEQASIRLKESLIDKCAMCGGAGRIYSTVFDEGMSQFASCPCNCMRRYLYTVNLMIAGVNLGAVNDILNEEMWERKVRELKISEINLDDEGIDLKKFTKEETNLIEEHIGKYMEKANVVCEMGYSYLFIGVNSVGKTFIAQKILHRFLRIGYSGHYIKFRKLMKLINRSMGERGYAGRDSREMLDIISDVDLLIIDELGKETGNVEHISGEVEELLKDRDMARKPTIVITNDDYDKLVGTYSLHIVGAFMRNYRVLIFSPKADMRKRARSDWSL